MTARGDSVPHRGPEDRLAVVRRGFELFNAGELEALFAQVFHPEVDYSGDPDISALTGFPVDASGTDAVRAVWEAFFAMFEEARVSDVELSSAEGDVVFGSGHMVARGGASDVPIDARFHFAWVIRDGRWRYLAVKTDRDLVLDSLRQWQAGRWPSGPA